MIQGYSRSLDYGLDGSLSHARFRHCKKLVISEGKSAAGSVALDPKPLADQARTALQVNLDGTPSSFVLSRGYEKVLYRVHR